MRNDTLKKTVLAGMLLAVGLVLPFLTGQIQEIGNKLLPMHLPVLLCGLICGWKYGGAVGFILPPFRSLLFGMPVIYPNAVAMAFELAAYGLVIGLLFSLLRRLGLAAVYISLLAAMLAGRVVWGLAQTLLWGLGQIKFSFAAFLTVGFVNALPGIILQLILIPLLMLTLERTKLVHFGEK